ncbi:beta-agarase [Vibrio sp. SM6]|uniref:Beta-agarase n=1 Tax=Vibrio agarilyticus TaxID=2726741 RepID=A0A7X8TTD7_9VIBR|nr:beta-agarase [Vibrio agarilyticus]NLS14222.1 beta-agarase [Vibrio agarilyticus]
MKFSKLVYALLISGVALPSLAATQLVTSFEQGEKHSYTIDGYGDAGVTPVTEPVTNGVQSLKVELGAKYAGGAKIYAPTWFGWGEQKYVVFDIVNLGSENVNYGVKALSNDIWEDRSAIFDLFNVEANTTLKDVKFSLDTTEWGNIGAEYTKAGIMELQFFTGETPNQTVYIDNIRISDGEIDEPVEPGQPEPASKVTAAPVNTLQLVDDFEEQYSHVYLDSGVTLALVDSKVSQGSKAAKINFPAAYDAIKFYPSEAWNWSNETLGQHGAIALDVTNTGDQDTTLYGRLQSGYDSEQIVGTSYGYNIKAGETKTVYISLNNNAKLNVVDEVGMRQLPAYSMSHWEDPIALDLAQVSEIRYYTDNQSTAEFVFDNLRVIPDLNHQTGFSEIVDALGQNNHFDFTNKIKSKSQLSGLGAKEAQLLGKLVKRSPYGGALPNSGIEADQSCVLTNAASFNVCKTPQGKWYLVDPEGNAFFSSGLANIRLADTYTMTGVSNDTPSSLRQGMFTDIPSNYINSNYGPVFSGPVTRGEAVSFYGNNRDSRHGDEATWRINTVKRFQDWGFNTLGNWTDPSFYAMSEIPFVVNGWVNSGPGRKQTSVMGPDGYWGKLPDPWDSNFSANAKMMADEIATQVNSLSTAQKLKIVGIFVDNEMSWDDEGNPSNTYRNLNGEAKTMAQIAEQYYSVVSGALEAAGLGNYLYLGNRFADWGRTPEVVAVAAKYADVLSFNIYKKNIAEDWDADQLAQIATLDRPVIIGEYHFGALDSGNYGEGIQVAASQKDRAEKYAAYMDSVLANKHFVGAHWFQYIDSPIAGRAWDGENYNVGFVNVTDAPYTEMTDKARVVNCQIYGDDCASLDPTAEVTMKMSSIDELYSGNNIGVTQADLISDNDPEDPTGPEEPANPETNKPYKNEGGSLSVFGFLMLVILRFTRCFD